MTQGQGEGVETAQNRSRGRRRGPRPGVTVYLPAVAQAADLIRVLEEILGNEPSPRLGQAAHALEPLEKALERRLARG